MKAIIFLTLLLSISVPAFGQRDFFSKQASIFSNRPSLSFQATLLRTKTDYIIVSKPGGEQQVIWLTRYSTLNKKHGSLFQRTRKVYIDELVPGTDVKIEAVKDEEGRLILKKLTVHDTIQEFEPVDSTDRDR